MKIVDAFIFYNELELLNFRLQELNDYVDYFVLVESRITHSGNMKDLIFDNNKHLFKNYLDKIIHVIVDDLPEIKREYQKFEDTPARIREEYQRNAIREGLERLNLNDDDIVIISDADEIVNPTIIEKYKNENFEMLALEQDFYFYSLTYKYPKIWTFPKVVKYKVVKKLTPEEIRLSTDGIRVPNGGWHFSYFFGADTIIDKLKNFSHQEFNNEFYTNEEYVEKCINEGVYLFDNTKLELIEIENNNNLPKNYKILSNKKLINISGFELIEEGNLKLSYEYLGKENIKIKIAVKDAIFKTVEVYSVLDVSYNGSYWTIFSGKDVHPFCNTHFSMGIDIVISNFDTNEIIHEEVIPFTSTKKRNNSKSTFWVIGDSHVGNMFNKIDKSEIFTEKYIINHVSHFLLTISKFVKSDWNTFLDTIPIIDGDVISFFLGEIDFRIYLLWKSNIKKNNLDDNLNELLLKYLDVINKIKKKYPNCDLIVLTPNSALRDTFKNKELIIGTEKERLYLWKKFDEFFNEKNITYWNCMKDYIDNEGFMKTEYLSNDNSDHHVNDGTFFIKSLKRNIENLKNKSVFLITSYCNTHQKIEALQECIDNLKGISNDDICIHAHYSLSTDIQNQVDYYLYDKSNPILSYPEKFITWWRQFNGKTFHIYKDDYGYTVLQQWKRSFDFLKNLYDNIIILNYDVIISQNLVEKIKNNFQYDGCAFLHENTNYISPLITIKTNSTIFEKITVEEYKKINGFAENFVEYLYNTPNFYKFKYDEYKNDFYTTLDFEGEVKFQANKMEQHNSPYDAFSFDDFDIFMGENEDKLKIFFYNIKNNLDVFISYNELEIFNRNINTEYFLDTQIIFNQIDFNHLKIIINQKEIKISQNINLCKIL